jgi:hypothetical protein
MNTFGYHTDVGLLCSVLEPFVLLLWGKLGTSNEEVYMACTELGKQGDFSSASLHRDY